MPMDPGLSQKAAESLGLPTGMKFFSPFPMKGMNQQSSRIAIPDDEFFYTENYIRIGDGNLRTLWDQGAPIYTAPSGRKIIRFFFYNIAATNFVIVFLDDGTAVQVNPVTLEEIPVSGNPNTFYVAGSSLPATSQWGTLYLIIANNITPNSYWIWDGTILYSPGGLGPGVTLTSGGSAYTSVPTVTAFGGSGSGIIAVATIANGSVVNILITNPGTGYVPGDVVQFAFTGGGSDDSAILQAVLIAGTVDHVQLVTGGTGYTPGTYALVFSGGGGGSGAAGDYTVDGGGVVVSTTITNPGSGYTETPTVAFPSGGGSGAAGTVFLNSGSVDSVTVVQGGTGFTGTPTLTFQGGGGTGATATANLTDGAITSVTVSNAGMNYTSAPTVIVQSGINRAASATATLMPFGVSGNSVETFQQRVWLGFPNQTGNQSNGGTILISAPGSLTDFSTSNGGLTYVSTDPFLRSRYVNLRQSNGYLYPIADSSVDVISNVNTSGSPTTTTFNYQNTDPQIGTSWRDTCADFSRTILLANPLGVYGLYGGSVTKISGKMDRLFTKMVPPQNGGVTPCSAIANIFSQRLFLMLMTTKDTFTGLPRNVMIAWDEKEWYVASQSSILTYIGTQEVDSNITAWGSDGVHLVPLFNVPSTNIDKVLSSKLYGQPSVFVIKQAMGLYVQVQDETDAGSGVTFQTATVDTELNSYPVPNEITFAAGTPTNPPKEPIFPTQSGDVVGANLGFTLRSNSLDFSINNLVLGHVDVTGLFGSTDITGEQGQ